MTGTTEGSEAAQKAVGPPSPLLRLENELLDHIVSFVAGEPNGQKDLFHLALSVRRFGPYVRRWKLRFISISEARGPDATIDWLETSPADRHLVKRIRARHVLPTVEAGSGYISQACIGKLLKLVPNLRHLEFTHFASTNIEEILLSGLRALSNLETFEFLDPLLSFGRPAQPVATMLRALSVSGLNRLQLGGLCLPDAKRHWPTIRTRQLRLGSDDPFAGVLLLDVSEPLAPLLGGVVALHIDVQWARRNLIQSIASTLRALRIDGEPDPAIWDLDIPTLELVWIRRLRSSATTRPAFQHVRTAVISSLAALVDSPSEVLEGLGQAPTALRRVFVPANPSTLVKAIGRSVADGAISGTITFVPRSIRAMEDTDLLEVLELGDIPEVA